MKVVFVVTLLLNITSFFFKDFIFFILRKKGREGREKKRENINMWLPLTPPPPHNWESNGRPFGSQASAQPSKPHQPGSTSHRPCTRATNRKPYL